MAARRPRLDWSAAKSVPILSAAQLLGAALVDKRQQRCPFEDHPDDTPSFSLDSSKNLFLCFGCGRKGSVIEFVAAYKKVGNADACRWLLGLPADAAPLLPAKPIRSPSATPSAAADPEIYEALLTHSPIGVSGRAYLAQRCIGSATAELFRVAQIANPAATLRALTDQFGAKRVAASGLLTARGYFRFPHNALLFAHCDRGIPLFLQSRRLDSRTPRWMGLGGISKIPFNLDAIEGVSEVYLVEGAIDVLSAHELGLTAIGLPGTSAPLSSEICRRLRHKTVYILPDKDTSGARIATSTRETLLSYGVLVTIQRFKAGKDLNDHLVQERGHHA
ncbi:CHC2 zinc finger domain-containing protein [Sphingopyxis chilensis]|uniref:CHC2 zinc finger domain-containing protein n=1 Tax=Sphingopyxis chilensis TaxID=180400 RepID=UPI002DDCCE6C|nr:CHC2 zinc finger domain-containing protein [Sphingopyxis chilensis]